MSNYIPPSNRKKLSIQNIGMMTMLIMIIFVYPGIVYAIIENAGMPHVIAVLFFMALCWGGYWCLRKVATAGKINPWISPYEDKID